MSKPRPQDPARDALEWRRLKGAGAIEVAVPPGSELVPIDQVETDPANARLHDERQLAELEASIVRFGIPKVPVLRGRRLLAGAGTLIVCRRLGLSEIPVVRADHLSDEEARGYALADNRIPELADWDRELLQAELAELAALDVSLDGLGWDADELGELLDLEGDAPARPPTSSSSTRSSSSSSPAVAPAEPTPPPAAPFVEAGDVWSAGVHRFACTDSTTPPAELLDFLELEAGTVPVVVTDPPFAIYGSSSGVDLSVADDRMVRSFFRDVLLLTSTALRMFGHAYTFCDWRSWPAWFDSSRALALQGGELVPANLIVWDKGDFGLGSNYRNCYELAGFWQRRPRKQSMRDKVPAGVRAVLEPNILRCGRVASRRGEFERDVEGGEFFHQAQKPVDGIRTLLRNSSDRGDVVLDPYVGSGSTAIAAELEGRRAIVVDVNPGILEVALRRWQRLTGELATRADGATLPPLEEPAA